MKIDYVMIYFTQRVQGRMEFAYTNNATFTSKYVLLKSILMFKQTF